METQEQTGQVKYADGTASSKGVLDPERARPIVVSHYEPVEPETLMLDVDHLAMVPVPDHIDWAKHRTVAEVESAIRAAENTADEHQERMMRARQLADTLRGVLHETANTTERAERPANAAR